MVDVGILDHGVERRFGIARREFMRRMLFPQFDQIGHATIIVTSLWGGQFCPQPAFSKGGPRPVTRIRNQKPLGGGIYPVRGLSPALRKINKLASLFPESPLFSPDFWTRPKPAISVWSPPARARRRHSEDYPDSSRAPCAGRSPVALP